VAFCITQHDAAWPFSTRQFDLLIGFTAVAMNVCCLLCSAEAKVWVFLQHKRKTAYNKGLISQVLEN
jgi:hypothetical protein